MSDLFTGGWWGGTARAQPRGREGGRESGAGMALPGLSCADAPAAAAGAPMTWQLDRGWFWRGGKGESQYL